MNRWIWIARIFGITVFLVLVYLLVSLQRRLVHLQEMRPAPSATSTTSAP
ncbi:MAG TPA: hypothetical protein VEZ11_01495 [Thermoanaerobaculia bacterium]|nr:hypothetical protein [Thermoanaerobaculia bacterium]